MRPVNSRTAWQDPAAATLTNPGKPQSLHQDGVFGFPRREQVGETWVAQPDRPRRVQVDISVLQEQSHSAHLGKFQTRSSGRNSSTSLNHRQLSLAELTNAIVFDQSGNPISSAGLITPPQTTSRQIQFALKLIW